MSIPVEDLASTRMFKGTLEGEFIPPNDPLGFARTLVGLALSTYLRGELSSNQNEEKLDVAEYVYTPLWETKLESTITTERSQQKALSLFDKNARDESYFAEDPANDFTTSKSRLTCIKLAHSHSGAWLKLAETPIDEDNPLGTLVITGNQITPNQQSFSLTGRGGITIAKKDVTSLVKGLLLVGETDSRMPKLFR